MLEHWIANFGFLVRVSSWVSVTWVCLVKQQHDIYPQPFRFGTDPLNAMSVTGYAFQNELLKAFNLSQPRDIQSGIMRVATVASLILSILGQPLRGAADDRVADRNVLRRRIQHITEGADDVKLNALPNVFRHVCVFCR